MKNNTTYNDCKSGSILFFRNSPLDVPYWYIRPILFFILLIISLELHAQKVLLTGKYLPRVEHALSIVAKYEPDIYADIIRQSYIQLGEIPGQPGTSFCILDDAASTPALWIMLSPLRLRDATNLSIASVIVHEAMHLRYNLAMKGDPKWTTDEAARHLEHTTIYNYQLFFLKRVGASREEIEGVRGVMRSLSIPIIHP
ncbi:MAG: hypothetical protein IM571_04760 [Chitinophagaceae bacterium]|jgi:hypothetical protein|nr:hypothetical protein [Chitinophagaceae bacterium]MCA6477245.1 hypothetical protein [Chitinophagaceae bacterium]MCA6491564.1 hypothetical protein [Chitinophagaceae bacterium]MCA6498172.1 hypothetical protein [Chitinophagaceae bacterium]MCA6512537.1 hypothetical protein [Chitinophagaceae bacterium]